MNREDVQMLGFEIVAYAGEATSLLMEALQKYLAEDYHAARELYNQGSNSIIDAHKLQTEMLQKEATGVEIPYSFTMGHGQDHLMTAVLLREVIDLLLKSKNV